MPIGSVLSGIGSIIGGNNAANASKSAAQAEVNATDAATAAEINLANNQVVRQQPFMGAGRAALGVLEAGLGVGGTPTAGVGEGSLTASFNPANLANMPGYQFQLQQGEEAGLDAATAGGGVGGATLKALTSFGQGLAGTNEQQYFNQYTQQQQQLYNQLMGVAGLGENATAGVGNNMTTVGGEVGSNTIAGGQATASGIVGASNALNAGYTGAGNAALLGQIYGATPGSTSPWASFNPFAPSQDPYAATLNPSQVPPMYQTYPTQ